MQLNTIAVDTVAGIHGLYEFCIVATCVEFQHFPVSYFSLVNNTVLTSKSTIPAPMTTPNKVIVVAQEAIVKSFSLLRAKFMIELSFTVILL